MNGEMEFLALSIDRALDEMDDIALNRLNDEVTALLGSSNLDDSDLSSLHYWQSNIFSGLGLSGVMNRNIASAKQLGALRRSIASVDFEKLPNQHRIQVRTNLGNAMLDHFRFQEAIEHYDKALLINPNYGLTLANRARGLTGYARYVNDASHQQMMLSAARQNYLTTLGKSAVFESIEQLQQLVPQFAYYAEGLKSVVDDRASDQVLKKNEKRLGRSKSERAYRQYCLENALFLNPLNDAFVHPIAATDSLVLTSICKPLNEADHQLPTEFSLYNRIKQEYVTARFLLYEGLTTSGLHFSDREVKLADTYDYTVHGLAYEKLRIAYRVAYGVLDRVAVLINHYWRLGHKPTSVGFPRVWYEKRNSSNFHPVFLSTNNPVIEALISLSKDMHSEDQLSLSEPDARFLADLRNALEHRFVEVTDDFMGLVSAYTDIPKSGHVRIPLSILQNRTLRMLKMARSACINVCLAINIEEQNKPRDDGFIFGSSVVGNVRDEDKQRPAEFI